MFGKLSRKSSGLTFWTLDFEFHSKSPDFKHGSTEEAVWIGRCSTPQCVVPGGGRSESCSRVTGGYRTATAVESSSPQRDVFQWTALISQHAKCGQGRQALRLYEEMRQGGVEPNSYTFVAALKACTSIQDLDNVKRIHAEVVECGCESDEFVGTMLVDVYAKYGRLVDARDVFEKLSGQNVVSWNAMISGYAKMGQGEEALRLYARMQKLCVVPNDRTFVSTLKACSSLATLEEGNEGGENCGKKWCLKQVRAVHSDIMKAGSELSVFVGTMLVDVYAKCGSLVDARSVFEAMPHRNAVSWTALILGYAQMEEGEEALHLYARMQQEGVLPDSRTFVAALKSCSSKAALEEGNKADGKGVERCLEQVRSIHAQAVKGKVQFDVYVGTTLVDVYIKCGSLVDSRSVFEKLPHRTVVSWNAIILGYAKMGNGEEAWQLYSQMQQEDVAPNEQTFVAALKACSSLVAFEAAERQKSECLKKLQGLHTDIENSGIELTIFLATMLVDVYARCGSLVDARSVFEKMPRHDVVSWNAMILGHAHVEDGEGALQLYTRMEQEGLVPNERTFVGALKACGVLAALEEANEANGKLVKQRSLEHVRAIHLDIVKSGAESAVYVGSMLVDVYAKCGSLVDARYIFERISYRTVVSWTAMISGYAQLGEGEEALQLYNQMRREGVVPNDRTFVGALKACSCLVQQQCLEQVRAIHSDVVEVQLESNIFVGNMLVAAYANCGNLMGARDVFEKISDRNVVSWTAMISGYTQLEEGAEALQLYARMQQEGVVADDQIIVCVLKACRSLALSEKGSAEDGENVKQYCLEQIRAIHSYAVKRRSHLDIFVENMLLDAYAKCGSLVDARCIFDNMYCRDVVSWTTLILGYAQVGEGNEALQLYGQMQQEGIAPNERTFLGALKACSTLAALEHGNKGTGKLVKVWCLDQVRAIQSDLKKAVPQSDIFLETMLVDVYAKCESLVDARSVFEKMPYHNVVSWGAMILGYAKTGKGAEALQLYARMQQEGVEPNDQTIIGALNACGSLALVEKGKEIHAQITKIGLYDLVVATSLIDMYGKCGSMEDAQKLFDGLPTRDVVTWNALIAGYAHQGDSQLVFDLFERMKVEDINPDGFVFVSVLTACNHAGLVEKGQTYFKAMSTDYGITPTIDHYTSLVDLLGRAGEVDKALEMVKAMPCQPDSVVWRTILGACQKWHKVDIGRQAFQAAVRLDRNDAAAYVLMSNIYAAAHMPDHAREVQSMRVNTRVWKTPGQSWWTDLDGHVHTFTVGDGQHPESQDIYEKLHHLVAQMKNLGYVPHLASVLRDIPADEKEAALCGHSEKLAIAYALLKTPQGTTIRVVKNLRVCEDCHAAIALISKMEQRTIICRDASRFHVYKEGTCSCRNYW